MTALNDLDIGLVVLYFLFILGLAFITIFRHRIVLKRSHWQNLTLKNTLSATTEGYFLAGRQASWWAVGPSLISVNIGSEQFIGLAASGAALGLGVGHFEWLSPFFICLSAWVFLPIYRRADIFTTPEFLEKRYSNAARSMLALITLLGYIFAKISVALYSGSVIFDVLLGWNNHYLSAMLILIITGFYAVIGGLSSVIYTGLIQTAVLLVGCCVITGMAVDKVGGISALIDKTPAHFWGMMRPVDDEDLPWTGVLFGYPIVAIWYWCTDQVIVQRQLAAKSDADGKSAAVLAGGLKILPVFLIVLPGICARVLFADEIKKDPNVAFPKLIAEILPHGLLGIVVASMLAAIMSSLASVFNSCSTIFTIDFYQQLRRGASQQEMVLVGRIAGAVVTIFGLIWIPVIPLFGDHLWIYLQSIQAYFSAPISTVFLFGIFWKRGTDIAAILTIAFGSMIGVSRLFLDFYLVDTELDGAMGTIVQCNFLHFGIFLFLACNILFVGVSLCSAPREDHWSLEHITWNWEQTRENMKENWAFVKEKLVAFFKGRGRYDMLSKDPSKTTTGSEKTELSEQSKPDYGSFRSEHKSTTFDDFDWQAEYASATNVKAAQLAEQRFHRYNWLAALILLSTISILIIVFR